MHIAYEKCKSTEQQIVSMLKHHETVANITDIGQVHGISNATLHQWKARYGGMVPASL